MREQILAGQVVRLIFCVGRETLREFSGERVAKEKNFDIRYSFFDIYPPISWGGFGSLFYFPTLAKISS
jgi:hypothetical protein